jgi:hypothetical protein
MVGHPAKEGQPSFPTRDSPDATIQRARIRLPGRRETGFEEEFGHPQRPELQFPCRATEELSTPGSFSSGMGDVGTFELWWREQVPHLTRAYLPILAARLGGITDEALLLKLWNVRVLPALRTAAASTVDDFESRIGHPVVLTGIDVATGTVAVATQEQSHAR